MLRTALVHRKLAGGGTRGFGAWVLQALSQRHLHTPTHASSGYLFALAACLGTFGCIWALSWAFFSRQVQQHGERRMLG
jgi:hypothetical protein